MIAGIEVYSPTGSLYMDGTGRYGRVIEIFQPPLGTGSKTYPDIEEASLDFAYFQGDTQVLTVWKSGQSIHWRLDDAYYAGGFSGSRLLVVVAF